MRIIDLGVCLESQEQPEIKNDIGDGRTILIPPDDGSGCPGRIHTLYINDGGDCPCVAPEQATGEGPDLTWDGTDKEVPNLETPEYDTKTETTHDPYPSLAFAPPPTCRWVGTTIDAITLSRDTVLVMYRGDGADPCHTPGQYKTQITHNQITPGAKLVLTHYLDCNPPQNIITASRYDWWRNCCIAGGKILAINGELTDAGLEFDMAITGVIAKARPSDWLEYSVGLWGIVLNIGGSCQETDNKGDIDMSGGFPMIVPFRVGDFQALGDCDTIDFATRDNRLLFGLRAIPAVVIEVNANADTADVETDRWGRLNDVPIHYHCPGKTSVHGGSAGFAEDAEVVLAIAGVAYDAHLPGPANPPQLRWIIGFWDGNRRGCFPDYWIFKAQLPWPDNNRHYITVYDINARAVAEDIPDGYGGFLVFPCPQYSGDHDVLTYWKTMTQEKSTANLYGTSDSFGKELNYIYDGTFCYRAGKMHMYFGSYPTSDPIETCEGQNAGQYYDAHDANCVDTAGECINQSADHHVVINRHVKSDSDDSYFHAYGTNNQPRSRKYECRDAIPQYNGQWLYCENYSFEFTANGNFEVGRNGTTVQSGLIAEYKYNLKNYLGDIINSEFRRECVDISISGPTWVEMPLAGTPEYYDDGSPYLKPNMITKRIQVISETHNIVEVYVTASQNFDDVVESYYAQGEMSQSSIMCADRRSECAWPTMYPPITDMCDTDLAKTYQCLAGTSINDSIDDAHPMGQTVDKNLQNAILDLFNGWESYVAQHYDPLYIWETATELTCENRVNIV